MLLWFLLGLMPINDTQSVLFDQLVQHFQQNDQKGLPFDQLLLSIAERQLDKPYLERTLEAEGPERLIVRLDGFDCFTLVETVLAVARCLASSNPGWDPFQQILQTIRYRQGELIDYTSRLHYTTDWAYDNQRKGILQDVTQAIGGQVYDKTIHFMSQHRDAYRQLSDDLLFSKMAPIEEAINQRSHFYIEKARLAELEKAILPADVIAITTSIKGLDVAHVGFAYFQNGRLHMLHASSSNKRVEITDLPLADYLAGHKSQTGVMIFRPATP